MTRYNIKKGKYLHFKGGQYEVLHMASHSETMEDLVVYRALYDEKRIWVRPAAMWNHNVFANGKSVKRFELIESYE